MARQSYKNLDLNFIKSKIEKFKANVSGIVYNGLVHETSRRTIISNLKNQARYTAAQCGFNAEELTKLYQTSYKTYVECLAKSQIGLSKARKQRKGISYHKYLKNRSNVVYDKLNDILFTDNTFAKDINSIIYAKEKQFRANQIEKLFNTSNYTPFMLCSAHTKPAEDHKDYQGKMYFDLDYSEKIQDAALLAKVNAYIRNHKLISVQGVMGDPVYLTTRKNCKHYFVPIPIEKVLGTSVNRLLQNYHMVRDEQEQITPALRAKNIYRNRYRMRAEMWKVMPNEKLAKDMAKDRQLITKWTRLSQAD